MLVIGITGGSGTGKSTLGALFSEAGAMFIDADAVYHRLLKECEPMKAGIGARFGGDILKVGAIDREKLGRIVFSDPAALSDLNTLTHKYVTQEIDGILKRCALPAAVIDAIGLFQSGADKLCDVTIGVIAPSEARVSRITERDGISPERALLRIKAQESDGFYRARCGYIIENSGSKAEFIKKARALRDKIMNGEAG